MVNWAKNIFLASVLAVLVVADPALAGAPSCAESYSSLEKARAWSKLARGKALVKLDSESFSIFEKVRMNPEVVLSTEEQALIQANELGVLLDQYRKTNTIVRKINQLIALQRRAQPIKPTRGKWHGFKKWGSDWYHYLGYSANGMLVQDTTRAERLIFDYLLQAFLPANRFSGPTQYAAHIYAKALKADYYGLSEFDRNFLKTWGFEKDYARFVADAEQYREGFLTATKIQDVADGLKWSVMIAAPAAAAAAPFLAPREESVEGIEARVKDFNGVQLLYSDDPAVPALLRSKGEAVLFEMPSAKFLKGEKLAEFDRMLAEKKVNYQRVLINANPEETKRVMGKAKEFVTRTKTNERGDLILDTRSHLDSGLAESYKIFESELGFPPAPIVKRYGYGMSAYFGLMKVAGGEGGRIKDFFAARPAPNSKSKQAEASEDALQAYLDAMIYAFSPKLAGGAMLALDAVPNTLMRNERVIKTKERIEREKLEEERVEKELRERGPMPLPPSVPISQ